jgi:multisubunit Na+/H+ antiporter MnhF subunit
MVSLLQLPPMSPEHATLLFVLNFVGTYLVARYARPAAKPTSPNR